MSDTTMTISLSLVAFDKMSRVIRESVKKSDEEFTKLQNKIKKVSENLEKVGKAATVAGGILTAMSAANLKMAADFETGMASVSTLIDTNVESLSDMNKEVLNIAKRTPVALNDLTSALYDIRSAGIAAENQFIVLEKSAQLGVAGLGSTSEAVDLVTSSLNAFQVKDCIAKVSQVIRDHLPHSPAKTGPLKDLHKVKIVETVAQTIKPLPLKNAMNKSLSFFTSGANAVVRGVNSAMSAPITIHYSPTITCNGNTTKDEFKEMLNKHKEEILKIFRQEYERKLRVAY